MSEYFNQFRYLYNITHIDNLPSILMNGILSKNEMKRYSINEYKDISNPDVQKRRERRTLNYRQELHDYANLYFNPRNAMLYYVQHHTSPNQICLLRINKKILDLDNVIITNQNAAVEIGTRLMSPIEASSILDFKKIQRNSWDDPNPIIKDRIKKEMMAEVLVKDRIPKEYICEILVDSELTKRNILNLVNTDLPIVIDPRFFF